MSETSNPLVRAYRAYIGPGTSNEAIGYWLFVAGALLGVFGIAVYVYSTTLGGNDVFGPREIAAVLASVGLVLLLLGVVVRLPTHPIVTYVGLVGAAVSIAATVWFTTIYPADWPTPEGDPQIVGLYGIGAAILVLAAIILPAVVRTPEDVLDEYAEAKTASSATFEVYRDSADDHRWRLRHDNGHVIATAGQGYSSKQKARQGLESVRTNAGGAPTSEVERPEDAAQASFEVYEDNAGEWRWRLRHDNGNIIGDSGEGYASRDSVDEAVDRVRSYAATADTLTFESGAFDIYRDRSGEWRWRLLARNGRITADGGEGYTTRSDARRAVETVRAVENHEFEVYEDQGGRFRWRLVAGNHEVVADSGQGYSDERGARQAVERVKRIAPEADTLTLEAGAFDLFKDASEQWRWRLLAPNGETIADSGEGYSSRPKAHQGLQSVRRNAPHAPLR